VCVDTFQWLNNACFEIVLRESRKKVNT